MPIDKTSQRLILIVSTVTIFYSQLVIWQRPQSNFMDAQYHLQRGRDLASEEEFQKAVRLDPVNASIHYELANYYISRADRVRLDLAYNEYKKAILLSSEKQQMDILKHLYCSFTKDYLKLERICSGSALSELTLGMLFMDNKRYNEAITTFRKSIELAKKGTAAKNIEADAYAHIGRVYFFKGELNKAIVNLSKSLGIMPDRHGVLDVMGYAYLEKGRLAKARRIFEKSVKLQPESGWAYYGLGAVYEKYNLKQRAREYYGRALKVGLGAPEQEKLIIERIESLKH